jgi:methyl-accepting chemotaxis protein
MVAKTETVAEETSDLIHHATQTVDTVKQAAGQISDNFERTAARIQLAADELASTLRSFNDIAKKVSAGKGTMGRVINDPRLYEALTDTSNNLSLTLKDLRQLIAQWQEKGIKMKME